MTVVHLTASPCFGGPERQMLELGRELRGECRSAYISFLEEGRGWEFIREAERRGFAAFALTHDTPRLLAALKELTALLRKLKATVLCCHGYKAGILGRGAPRRIGVPVIAVSRGWTGESLRVRAFEFLDRMNLRWMDKVVCVSEAQAEKVRRAGVRDDRITVIRNAIRPERFADPDPACRGQLRRMFPGPGPEWIVGAAGRLSPEKGFGVLVDAAAEVVKCSPHTPCAEHRHTECADYIPSVGFVLFGDGPLRESLATQIAARGLEGKFVLAGFRSDLDRFLPHLDLFVQSSFTEGLPNVVLEAYAAGVPVVATAVGGTPEIIENGVSGCLVGPDPAFDKRQGPIMNVRHGLRNALVLVAVALTAPLWIPVRLFAALDPKDNLLLACSQFLSLIPGLGGIFLRRGFYFMSLESFSPDCTIEFGTWVAHRRVTIGRCVYIGGRCTLGMCSIIGRNAWIGNSAVVMADVGDGTVIGAGSVVVKPVPSGTVAVGNPCVVKKMRCPADLSKGPAVAVK
jgi:glycosyltransferase involved in cell wall biosynthesis